MDRKPERHKEIWIVILVICSFIVAIFQMLFSQYISSNFSKQMEHQRRNSVSKMVNLAHNAVLPVVKRVTAGEISRIEARKIISDYVRSMTYQDEYGLNYIFMSTYDGTMLVQPYEPDKEGTNQWELKDANGKFIIQELTKAAKEKPHGSYVTYYYYLPDKDEVEEKLSYVIGIPEIDAYIGTGMYVESSYLELKKLLERQRYGFLGLTFCILLALTIYLRELVKSNHKLIREISERIYAQNKLQDSHDELSVIYEELTATEEELRNQYEELQKSQNETRELAERYMLVAEGSKDAIWDWDIKNNGLYVSERFNEMLGYDMDERELQYENILDLVHPEDRERACSEYQSQFRGESEFFTAEYRLMTKDGKYKWFMAMGKATFGQDGKVVRNAGSITDITERKRYEEEIKNLAYYDYLTGLPNRVYIVNELKSKLGKCLLDSCKGSVFFIDIDNFKVVNDTFGHSSGDIMLIEISKRLKQLISDSVIIGRIGGDEFIVVQDIPGDLFQVGELAKNILQLFAEPICVNENNFHVTCSIGIALYPKDGTNLEEILKNADLAMYMAKNIGKNRYALYESSMKDDLSGRLEMEKHLRDALKNNEFVLHYQPQIDAVKGDIAGFEALIRWASPTYGLVPPSSFIHAAEEMGLINEIGKWVIESSFSFARKLCGTGICISCNVSSMQLAQSNFVEDVIGLFEKYELGEESVALEITESCMVESFEEITDKLVRLRKKGILIYMDDFGTGYSSLTYLKNLPIDGVKIDKSFINDIISNGVERRIVKTIVSLAHEIGLKVVAEGVETREQLEYLAACRCNLIQGYLISKPVAEGETINFIKI